MSEFVVWCDFGGVISPNLGGSLHRVADSIGVTWPDIVAAANRVAAPMGLSALQPLELGMMSQDDWADGVMDELRAAGIEFTGTLRGFDVHWYAGRRLDEQLLAALADLRDRGIPVGMLTNSVLEWEPHRHALLGDDERFDAVLRSHEVQLAKPDLAVYAHAETMLGPADATRILIDDLEVNVVAARAAGWLGIQHRDTAETLQKLEDILEVSLVTEGSGRAAGR